ncbi:unnamed protein product [Camellia sinensis]
MTIEGSPCGDNCEGGAVNLSQLNLIDLAGFESSKAETTGVRQKEGSYINKSLLTLGTIFSEEHLGKQNCDEQDINADFFCSDGSACSCESVVAAAGQVVDSLSSHPTVRPMSHQQQSHAFSSQEEEATKSKSAGKA